MRVYDYMAGGLVLTGLIAFAVAQSDGLLHAVYGTPLRYVVMFAPLGIAFFFGFRIQSMAVGTAQALFWVFAAAMGLSLAYIFKVYTGVSIARTFFVTAGTFAGMSLYGYTTKRDLTAFGSFLIMGVWGLILALLVNLFLRSPALDFALSIIGVLVFTGLAAFDTQKIKEWYAEFDAAEVMAKKAIYGALNLYLDFINLFLFVLRFVGANRN
jgi:FtsH-binding integral membrane protein